MLYSIIWANFIVWLSFFLKLLHNICIAIICYPGCDIINFEYKLRFLINSFFYIVKKSGQKCKYFKNEKSGIRTIAPEESPPRLGLGFGLVLELRATFLGEIVLEPKKSFNMI